ncbi:hypothetical protein [Hyalangium gracile]|uniref:hypothetical protein n=1 Tax=Hyalangium gracile TaxID=394092 RepID=UPI001CCFA5EE|nr:hypothetical protein [Hyalangium gracile]
MKPIFPSALRRAVLCLPALGVMLAPLAANAREREYSETFHQESQHFEEVGTGGRSGSIEEFNFGPTGMDVIKQRAERLDEGDNRLLSGRVIDLKGRTLYVDREGVVVPLDLSALRITRTPQPGQEIIASYTVDQTRNLALSLAGEVAEAR